MVFVLAKRQIKALTTYQTDIYMKKINEKKVIKETKYYRAKVYHRLTIYVFLKACKIYEKRNGKVTCFAI